MICNNYMSSMILSQDRHTQRCLALFKSLQQPSHHLHHLLPPLRTETRTRGQIKYNYPKHSPINFLLFNFQWLYYSLYIFYSYRFLVILHQCYTYCSCMLLFNCKVASAIIKYLSKVSIYLSHVPCSSRGNPKFILKDMVSTEINRLLRRFDVLYKYIRYIYYNTFLYSRKRRFHFARIFAYIFAYIFLQETETLIKSILVYTANLLYINQIKLVRELHLGQIWDLAFSAFLTTSLLIPVANIPWYFDKWCTSNGTGQRFCFLILGNKFSYLLME